MENCRYSQRLALYSGGLSAASEGFLNVRSSHKQEKLQHLSRR